MSEEQNVLRRVDSLQTCLALLFCYTICSFAAGRRATLCSSWPSQARSVRCARLAVARLCSRICNAFTIASQSIGLVPIESVGTISIGGIGRVSSSIMEMELPPRMFVPLYHPNEHLFSSLRGQ